MPGRSSAEHRSAVNAAQVSEAFERPSGVTWWTVTRRGLQAPPLQRHGDDIEWITGTQTKLEDTN